jgi:hypothetical protein
MLRRIWISTRAVNTVEGAWEKRTGETEEGYITMAALRSGFPTLDPV